MGATTMSSSDSPWLYGRAADLLIGSGLAYLVTVPLFTLVVLQPSSTLFLILNLIIGALIAAPHYGATLLRVYETGAARRRYALFAVHISLVLLFLTGLGAKIPIVGSALLTLYTTWSPWHFSGQNYGITLMQLRRHGLEVEPFEKRLLYLTYLISFSLVFLAIHIGPSTANFAPQGTGDLIASGHGNELFAVYHVLRLGIPAHLAMVTAGILVGALLITSVWMFTRFARRASISTLLPAVLLLLTQSFWFTLPAGLRMIGYDKSTSLIFSALWISGFHSLQYLWVTSHYAQRSEPHFRMPRYLGKCLLAGTAITVVPTLVLAPGVLGNVPFDSGMALLVFSVVNLHHFILDGAVWKLRDSRVASVLLRDETPAISEPIHPSRSWLRRVVWAGAASSAVVMALSTIESRAFHSADSRKPPDLERAELALNRLRWLGRESAWYRLQLGSQWAATGNHIKANNAFERSLAIQPTSEAWLRKGALHQKDQYWAAALAAYDAALSLAPYDDRIRKRQKTVRRKLRRSRRLQRAD